MPELPEVEITRRRIAPLLVGRALRRVYTSPDSYVFLTKPDRLRRLLRSRRFEALERRGKYLLGNLDDGSRLLLHLGMTGQLFARGVASVRLLRRSARAALGPEQTTAPFEPDAHTHLRLCFDDRGADVLFRDVRKFGKIQLLAPGSSCARLERLGVDALQATGGALFRATRTRRASIKAVLLDQSVLAGAGNIYADEALFLAGIHPERAASRLRREECADLVRQLRRVMRRSLETGGSSINDFIAPDGRDGGYQDERRVYGRSGRPCGRCGQRIRSTRVGQRTTHYCPRCQGAA